MTGGMRRAGSMRYVHLREPPWTSHGMEEPSRELAPVLERKRGNKKGQTARAQVPGPLAFSFCCSLRVIKRVSGEIRCVATRRVRRLPEWGRRASSHAEVS